MATTATTPSQAKPAVKKGSSGLNPGLVIPILFVIGYCFFEFVLGSPSNFEGGDSSKQPLPGNYYGMVYHGGFVVPILITCLLTVIVFTIERLLTLGQASGKGSADEFVHKIRTSLDKGQIDEAIKACDVQKGSVGNVIRAGLVKYKALSTDNSLNKEQKLAALQKEIEEATTLELPMLQKNLTVVATLASASTLFALLGTVLGMIRSFAALGNSGAPDSSALATGISEALINTALGIGTAALATVSYAYLNSRVDDITFTIDEIGLSIQQSFATHHN